MLSHIRLGPIALFFVLRVPSKHHSDIQIDVSEPWSYTWVQLNRVIFNQDGRSTWQPPLVVWSDVCAAQQLELLGQIYQPLPVACLVGTLSAVCWCGLLSLSPPSLSPPLSLSPSPPLSLSLLSPLSLPPPLSLSLPLSLSRRNISHCCCLAWTKLICSEIWSNQSASQSRTTWTAVNPPPMPIAIIITATMWTWINIAYRLIGQSGL